MRTFTMLDVLDYYAGKLDGPIVRELELAREHDPGVAALFDRLRQGIRSSVERSPTAMDQVRARRGADSVVPANVASALYYADVPFAMRLGCDSELPPADLPAGISAGLSSDHRDVVIRWPVENVDGVRFPYGAALVEYRAGDGQCLSRVLMPVATNSKLGLFQGRLAVAAVVPGGVDGCDPGRLSVFPVDDSRLPLLTKEQVEQLFDYPLVRTNAELRAQIELLKSRVEAPDDERI